MESIAEIARTCLDSFKKLASTLTKTSAENRESMPPDKLELEFGRFKIWCGNLGVLQGGNSSLDSRLRDSTVIHSNVWKLLIRLNRTLVESIEVTSGARMPFELQPSPDDSDSDSSPEESESDDELPKELVLHGVAINEILSDLYKLSFKIRNSSNRPTSTLRIKLYCEVDEETGIDKFAAYEEFDKLYIEDSLRQLRRDAAKKMGNNPSGLTDTDQYLIHRLVATINQRRKVLRYWQRHANKLAVTTKKSKGVVDTIPNFGIKPVNTEAKKSLKPDPEIHLAPSTVWKTILSNTEATKFDKDADADDLLEVQSNISYASSPSDIDIDEYDVKLPPPPAAASKGIEFLCPYCGVVCPARHGKPRAWKSHILRDLQPYICTYKECENEHHIFSSQNTWLEHERIGHRRCWQCFEHEEPKFWSKETLWQHLQSEHGDGLTEAQIQTLIQISELSVEDTRTACPFCLLNGPFSKGLEAHMASHMRKFATFSISTSDADDADDASVKQSGCAQGLCSQDSQPSEPLHFESPPLSNVASDLDADGYYSFLPDKCTVAWICNTQAEYFAAKCFLNEEYESFEYNEEINYLVGRIGEHKIVVAVTYDLVIPMSVDVVNYILHNFLNIKIVLMVGIGGGLPSEQSDVRLGDVVVGCSPTKIVGDESSEKQDILLGDVLVGGSQNGGGVLQYDFGRQNQNFKDRRVLIQPPWGLREALTTLAIRHKRYGDGGRQLERTISDTLDRNHNLREKYKRPDADSDILYRSEITHKKGEDCATACGTEPSKLVPRHKRTEEDNPAIHYGLIASGPYVIKDAIIRDKLASDTDALCFYTGAGELANEIPCLVIRGICDYSDSHKNRKWQGYAAMVAAAYARALLNEISPATLATMENISNIKQPDAFTFPLSR